MKRLLLILILSTLLPKFMSSSSTSSKKFNHTRTEIEIVIPKKITLIPKVEIFIMPSSFIADSVFNHQINAESRGKHFIKDENGELKLIESSCGALGIAQFLPSTWNWLKARKVLPSNFSINNETHQRIAQRLFMNHLAKQDYGIEYSKVRLALASYNAGSGRVLKLIKKYGMDWEEHLPNETKKYIKIVIG